MRFTKLSALLAALVLPIAMSAQAAPIKGGISFSDGLSNFGNGPIVSTLTNIVDDPATVETAQNCSQDFNVPACPQFGAFAHDFTITSGDQILYTYNGFTFHMTLITSGPSAAPAFACTTNGCADGLSFTADGYVTHAGFDPTLITIAFTAQGTCNANTAHNGCADTPTASWSSSISSTGRVFQVPEPATATLIGIGLLAAGFASRRRKS